jgi:outer membrane protein OmpA-like peptidoglycan-associated protein
VLQLNPGLEIELASHTDSRADAAYNIELSNKRAKSCVNYLVNNGIQASRMKAVGYGEQFLVNDCKDGVDCSETEHQANRRTTIKFLKTDTKIKVR